MIAHYEEKIGKREVQYRPVENTIAGLTRLVWIFRFEDDPTTGYGSFSDLGAARNGARQLMFADRVSESRSRDLKRKKLGPARGLLIAASISVVFWLVAISATWLIP